MTSHLVTLLDGRGFHAGARSETSLIGGGRQLTPSLSTDTALTFETEHALPGGALEIVYAVGSRGGTSDG